MSQRKLSYKYRGRCKVSNPYRTESPWIYGSLLDYTACGVGAFICRENDFVHTSCGQNVRVGGENEVDPKTVGQWTGMVDKNGKEVYEGDIVQDPCIEGPRAVYWEESKQAWFMCGKRHCGTVAFLGEFSVIGNIYDNPKLAAKL